MGVKVKGTLTPTASYVYRTQSMKQYCVWACECSHTHYVFVWGEGGLSWTCGSPTNPRQGQGSHLTLWDSRCARQSAFQVIPEKLSANKYNTHTCMEGASQPFYTSSLHSCPRTLETLGSMQQPVFSIFIVY